jgi:osmoprotectant transport system substrate-binding protein
MEGDAVIRKHNRRAAKAAFAISLGVAIVLGLAACGGDGGGGGEAADDAPTIVLGSKDFAEQFILGELYKQALEANGFTVTYKENIGSTEIIHAALESGELNMYPEYTGVIVQVVHGQELSGDTAEATYDLAAELEAENGLTLLEPTPFFDTDAIAVLNETAEEHSLESVADLKNVPNLTLAGQPEFRTRNTGLVGLRNIYDITDVEFVPLAGISPYAALDSGDALAAAVFSTDPPLGEGSKYTVLDDPEHVFGFQNVAPIVKTDVLEQAGSAFEDTVNEVSALLTTDAIIAMNRAVIVDQQDPADVARQFLEENDLL